VHHLTRLSLGRKLCLGAIDLCMGLINSEMYYVSQGFIFQAITLYAAFGILSFFIPIDRPIQQRRLYVAINMLLVIGSSITASPINLLLSWAIVKTCFLLELKEVIWVVVLAGAAYTLSSILSLPSLYALINNRTIEDFLTPQSLVLSNMSFFLSSSIFSLLLSLMILAERKSRQQAERLAKEVEILSANLERTRIARDIHDSLGHSLTTLGVQLELAQKLRSRQPESADHAVNTAKQLLDQCLNDVRDAIHTIHHSNFNFEQALATLIRQVAQNRSLQIQTEAQFPVLSLSSQYQLYCVLREGFTNIQKHANASQIRLFTQITPEAVKIVLADDGQGFDFAHVKLGFGLQSMQERVQSLLGELIIHSTPGQGTTLHITLYR
jgi:signal transduction histidine kinase